MSEADLFPYDAVFYPGSAFPQTHPDRLSTIATLFGMKPALPSRCRVLELGCGVGANLCHMAYQYPDSEFVGIDLSAPTIARGQAEAASFGVRNLVLRACDIMQVDESFGQFDYIIAYGVYSWVPEVVRAKILTIFCERLTPHGVGLLSYNAYPGSHLRDLGRHIMLYHTRAIADPREKVQQGRAVLRAVAAASEEGEAYHLALRETLKNAEAKADPVLYHDDLNAAATAFLFHQVADAAQREGLQYLCESSVAQSVFGHVPQFVRACIDGIPPDDTVRQEQYLDLLVGRWFRETLFCRSDVALKRVLDPDAMKAFSVSGNLRPVSAELQLDREGVEEFETDEGDALGVESPIAKAAFLQLGRIWPQAIDFSALAQTAARMIGVDRAGPDFAAHSRTLADALWQAHRAAMLQLHIEPPKLAAAAGERPAASPFARKQAETGVVVTSLRHVNVGLDGMLHPLIKLLDGSRTLDELTATLAVVPAAQRNPAGDEAVGVSREWVARALDGLAKQALLVE